MTHEDFVSFKQAKLLKGLGFDWECTHYYQDGYSRECQKNIIKATCACNFNEDFKTMISAPTLAQAQKWLREVKRLDISINHVYHRLTTGNKVMYGLRIGNQSTFKTEFYMNYDAYEEALLVGINKALELIKN